jgi:chromate transporter
VAIFALQVPFPLIIVGAALAGYLGGRLAPAYFHAGGGHGGATKDYGRALIDEHSPRSEHTRYRASRLAIVLAAGALLWLLPMGALTVALGWDHTLTQMGWFFTKAALLTFGGAYAVLPYVYQGAVSHYGWVTPGQMIDGLALGETTPGPLIMVVAFVAFVGGYMQALFGGEALFLAGAVAAMLVTWFTFLPSFVFILAGGPLVESTHDRLDLTAPLTAITAAVVGVIVNLALFFGYHVLWPQGFPGPFEWPAAMIALGAAVALLRYRCDVMKVIGACALAGLALRLAAG